MKNYDSTSSISSEWWLLVVPSLLCHVWEIYYKVIKSSFLNVDFFLFFSIIQLFYWEEKKTTAQRAGTQKREQQQTPKEQEHTTYYN